MGALEIALAVAGGIKFLVDSGAIKTVTDALPYAEKIVAFVQGDDYTQEDLDLFMEGLRAMHDELQKPVGDPPQAA